MDGILWKIERVIDFLFESYPDKVRQAKLRPGNRRWFAGQIMKHLDGQPRLETVLAEVEKRFDRLAP